MGSVKIAISALGHDLDAPFSPTFGRCAAYIIADAESLAFQAIPNQAAPAAHGAGIQAAQEVIRQGVQAVITGNVGPNAYRVLAAAGVPVYVFAGGTVRQAAEAYRAGNLNPVSSATGPAHGGMGMMHGMGTGGGMGGQGMGMGLGRRSLSASGSGATTPAQPAPQPPAAASPPAEDTARLRAEVAALQDRLGELSNRIEGRGNQ